MKLNSSLLLIIGLIAGILLFPKLNKLSTGILFILSFMGYGITKRINISIPIAIIITYVLVLLNTENNSEIQEQFKNKKKQKKTSKNFKKKSKKSKKSKKKNEYFGDDRDELNEDIKEDDGEEHFFDSKASFAENYKSLSPSQVKGLNKDTRDLIKTQKSLLETLKTMGPAIKDGKNVLDSFKNYFGDDIDLGKMKN